MKKIPFLVFAIIVFIFFGSCKENCVSKERYILQKPIFGGLAQVDSSKIRILGPRKVQDPSKTYIYNSYIFLGEKNTGIHIIDNSNPQNPINLGFIQVFGNTHFEAKDSLLYLDKGNRLEVLDFKDLSSIEHKYSLPGIFNKLGSNKGLFVTGYRSIDTMLEVSCGSKKDPFRVLGIGKQSFDFESPDYTNSVPTFTIRIRDLLSVNGSVVRKHSISANNPPSLNTKFIAGASVPLASIANQNNLIFIGQSNGRMLVLEKRFLLDKYILKGQPDINPCDRFTCNQDFIFVARRANTSCYGRGNELLIYKLGLGSGSISNQAEFFRQTIQSPEGIAVKDNILFISHKNFGLGIYEWEPIGKNLRKISTMADDGTELYLQGNLLISRGSKGVFQYDVSNPTKPVLLSNLGLL